MIGINDRVTTTSVLGTYTILGATPPKALREAAERSKKLAEGARHLNAGQTSVESAVAAAILAGHNVAADAGVQAAVTAQALLSNNHLPEAISNASLDVIRDVCLDQLDAIVGDWSKAFDKAAAVMTSAHAGIGNLALDDTTSILAKGGDVADLWSTAQQAHTTIDTVINGWVSLMTLVRVSLNPEHRPLRLASLTAEQARTLPAKVTPWDAVRAGLTLSLPTLEEYRARIARLERDRADERTASVPVDQEREATRAWARKVEDANREAVSA